MLERYVKIRAYLGIGGHLVKDVLGEIGWIRIMDAYPLYPLHFREPAEQLRERPAAVEVQAVVGRVLCDDDELPDPLGRKPPGLINEVLHRHGAVGTADERDRAVGAAPVAAFGYLEEGIAADLAGQTAVVAGSLRRLHSQRPHDGHEVAGTEPCIHLRNESRKLGRVPL